MRIRGVERSVAVLLQREKNCLCNRCIARITGVNEDEVRYVTHRLQYARRYYVRKPDSHLQLVRCATFVHSRRRILKRGAASRSTNPLHPRILLEKARRMSFGT